MYRSVPEFILESVGADCMNSSSIDSKGKNWIYVSKSKNKEESKLTPMLLNCKCTNPFVIIQCKIVKQHKVADSAASYRI
jgi:hypothetical protein